MNNKELMDILDPQEKETPIFSKDAIKMKYPIESKGNLRSCGNCGNFYPLADYKRKKPGYDWKCKECNKFDEAYK